MLVVPGASPNFCFALDVVKHASEREPNREVLWPVRIQRYGMSCQFCTEKQCVTINTAVDRDHSVTQPPPPILPASCLPGRTRLPTPRSQLSRVSTCSRIKCHVGLAASAADCNQSHERHRLAVLSAAV